MPAQAYSGKTIKFTMMIKRRSDYTEAQFNKYWTEIHGPIVDKWLAKHGVIRYVQYHTPSSQRKLSEEVWNELGGVNVSDFDGHVELTVPNMDALKSCLNDPYYKSDVEPDEKKFLDAAASRRTVGWEELKIEDGEVLREKA